MSMEIDPQPFSLNSPDGTRIACFRWDTDTWNPRGVVQIAHGMGEHTGRYRAFAQFLCQRGWTVYGSDHRGHGQTLTHAGERGDFGPGGFQAVVSDLALLNQQIRQQHPKLPRILFGHSMGSFASQHFALENSQHIDALILSGSGSLDDIAGVVNTLGPQAAVERLTSRISPRRTPFDWLSSDPAAVDAFIADAQCFPSLTESAAASVLASAAELTDGARLANVRSSLPIRFYSGSEDPIGLYGLGVLKAAERYRLAGIRSVSIDFEVGARHELLNERQRYAVIQRIAAWLGTAIPSPQN